MPSFSYIGFSNDGAKKSGTLEAASRPAALQLLRTEGLKVLELNERSGRPEKAKWSFRLVLPAKLDLQRFFADIAVLMEAGLGLDRALKAMATDQNAGASHQLAGELVERLSSGKAPSEAFRAVGDAGTEVAALIASGEQTGKLAVVFSVIAGDMERQRIRRRQITEAIVYPAFLIVMMCAALLIVTFFLVPAILPIFQGADKQAPLMIRALDVLRIALLDWSAPMALVAAATAAIALRGARQARMKALISGFILSLPVIGTLVRKYGLARYLQSLALLLGNGVEMSKALAFATAACPLRAYTAKLEAVREEVVSGRRLPEALASTAIFPSAIISLTTIGDEINNLPSVLSRSAELLEGEALRIQNRLLALMTPTITIFMGVLIGGLVLSVMSALLSINELSIQ